VKLLGSTMTSPNTCDHTKIIQHIFEKVPDTDAPTTFSLPENADRAVQETAGGRYLTNLRALASVGALSSSGSQEALKGLLEPVMAVWNAAALNLSSITPPPSIPASDPNPSPMQVFFVSEVSLLNRLGRRIINIYADLKRVADGTLLPSDDLRNAATTLANGVVPDKWLDWMVGPESSALWLQLLQKRIDAMAAAFEGFTRSESSFLQQKLRLIEFLRPHTFLNALRQYTARKTNEPMVKLVLGAYPAGSGPKGSVHVTLDGQSLALQGAICNGSKLSPLDNNAPTTSPFPDVTISWLMADAIKTSGFVQLPVYQAQDRELHMFEVQVPCGSSEERDNWTLSGAAIYLS
jgi:dynein heavy chain 2